MIRIISRLSIRRCLYVSLLVLVLSQSYAAAGVIPGGPAVQRQAAALTASPDGGQGNLSEGRVSAPPVWQVVATSTLHTLWDVWAASPSEVFMVGDGGTVLKYDGSSVTSTTTPTVKSLRGVWGLQPTMSLPWVCPAPLSATTVALGQPRPAVAVRLSTGCGRRSRGKV